MRELIKKRQQTIIQSFEKDKDWESKYRRIIEWGKNMPPLPVSLHQSKWLIQGCQSQVWLYPDLKNGHLILQGDSDALITKGLLALMVYFYSDIPLELILRSQPEFIEELDLIHHLTPTRAHGLSSLVDQIQKYAQAFHIMNKNN